MNVIAKAVQVASMKMMSQTADADWECYRAFHAVLREGSLSAAARALRTAQPTVRRRIAELEGRIGTALFTRSPSSLEPTALARELVAPADALVAAVEHFDRTASAEADAPAGGGQITAGDVVGVEVLPPVLAGLQREHPGLVIELSLTNRNEDLLHREADIAVRMVRPAQDALVARRVGSVRLGFHAHRRIVETLGAPVSLEDLHRFPVLGYQHETATIRALQERGFDFERQAFAFRTDHDLGYLAAVRAGVGVGLCHVALGRRDPDLVHLLPEAFAYDLETWIVMHEDQRSVRKIRIAFERLAEALSAYAAT